MSPTIRSKGGLPLMVGGQVAGSQECCCENPPPPACWECADVCSYSIKVTQPSSIASTGFFSCNNGVRQGSARRTLMFGSILPSGFEDYPEAADGSLYGGFWNGSQSGAFVAPWIQFGPVAFVEHGRYGAVVDPPWEPCDGPKASRPAFGLRAVISALVSCTPGKRPTPYSLILSAEVLCYLRAYGDEKGGSCGGSWQWGASAEFDIGSTCITAPKRTCSNYLDQMRHLNVPITFSADGSTTSLGAYTSSITSSYGPMAAWCQSYGEALRDELTATFRITSRPSCLTVGCSCNAPLGGMYVTFGNLSNFPDGFRPEVLLNSSVGGVVDINMDSDERISWSGPFGLYEYDQYDWDGPQDNNGKYTRLLWRQRVEIACDVIDGVDQWLVFFTSFRLIYDGNGIATHDSYDEWIGKIDCYKACEDLDNYIDADESVPMGEPYDIEYIGRTTLNGRLECEPPPHATISLSQIYTC